MRSSHGEPPSPPSPTSSSPPAAPLSTPPNPPKPQRWEMTKKATLPADLTQLGFPPGPLRSDLSGGMYTNSFSDPPPTSLSRARVCSGGGVAVRQTRSPDAGSTALTRLFSPRAARAPRTLVAASAPAVCSPSSTFRHSCSPVHTFVVRLVAGVVALPPRARIPFSDGRPRVDRS